MEDFFILLGILFLSTATYVALTSYRFQSFRFRRRSKKNFVNNFTPRVKGTYHDSGYYASSHQVIFPREYSKLPPDKKASFYKCYNIVTFKTADANWELFFFLVKEQRSNYQEVMAIRSFPKERKIKSEGTVEKSYSRVNVLTNNRYLTGVLESAESKDLLRWILKQTGDTLYVSHNNLYYKAIHGKNMISVDRAMDIIKGIHNIKSRVFKKGIIEY